MGDAHSWERLMAEVERLVAGPVPDEAKQRGLVVLEIPSPADGETFAARLVELGPPIDMNVVSPPIRNPDRPDSRPAWDVKQSVCHEIAGRRVWFGTEKTDGVERLVSVAIHFDAPAPVKAEPEEHLPPEKRDGPFRLTMSIGWCGGHGEAVLNEADRPRMHDDLPIYVDGRSAEEIVGRVDLGGTWIGHPKVKIAGTGRLKRKRSRNASIPGAPKERYVLLIVSELLEARLVGERAED